MKNKTMRMVCAFLIIGATTPPVIGQEGAPANFSMGADMVSRYVWRGINLGGSSPAIQPFMEYSFGETGLTVGAWASYSVGLGLAGTEADLFVSYSPVDWLELTITDYFFPTDDPFERNDYFNYDPDETGHTLEAMVTLGGSDDLPFYATFAMNLFGADGVNEKGDNYNAKYIEVGYNGSYREYDFSVFAGFAPDNPNTDEGGEGWYGENPGLINLGITFSKDVKFANTSLPVFSSLIFNPEAGNMYVVIGISF